MCDDDRFWPEREALTGSEVVRLWRQTGRDRRRSGRRLLARLRRAAMSATAPFLAEQRTSDAPERSAPISWGRGL